MAAEGRLIVVSNRLPVTLERDGQGEASFRPSPGGLATGLAGPHRRSTGLWVGWPGPLGGIDPERRSALLRQLEAERLVPVELTQEEVKRFYEGYANGTLWPLFHYLIESLPLMTSDWETYQRVNQKFADRVAALVQEGDRVWIHDYQLMLVPAMLRRRFSGARIGFFLHIPFPSSEVFRILPHREELLLGLLGADLVGFHTTGYQRHFVSSVLRTLGLPVDAEHIALDGRRVRVGVFPMGIDAARFAELGASADVAEQAERLRGAPDHRLLIGIDRLDYTKGIPRRLLAFEELLKNHPDLRGRVRLLQVGVPSRLDVEAYRRIRASVDGLVGRINGEFGTPSWTPVTYLFRSLSEREVVALYRAADVMVVTPVRDGMNLVAKEFVAARSDGAGVLVLSEFAGAAAEMPEALLVNPYDVEGTALALHRALTLPAEEQRLRMAGLRRRVLARPVDVWVSSFLSSLDESWADRPPVQVASSADLSDLLERLLTAERLLLLLDYDGTLVPFQEIPELARPDGRLLALLATLAGRQSCSVHIVSGRTRETLQRWLGNLHVGLHGEHGLWSRPAAPDGTWRARGTGPCAWRRPVTALLEQFVHRTPGSLLELKSAALAWHYRACDPELGQRHANELQQHLRHVLSGLPAEVLCGSRVIEVRAQGMHKGAVVSDLLREAHPQTLAVAIGDDQTDEDMFGALPEGAISLQVGEAVADTRASLRLANRQDLRTLLEGLAAGP